MKKNLLAFFCITCINFINISLFAQTSSTSSSPIPLYVSKQTGACTTPYTGGYSKTTDRYEHGTVTLTKTGPITYTVDPNDLSIDINSSKSWNGSLGVDVASSPDAGNSAAASISANYSIFYSHFVHSGESCASGEYSCPGCAAHTGKGCHEIINVPGNEVQDFTVYSILLKISGKTNVCKGDTLKFNATTYPSGGSVQWSTGETGNIITLIASDNLQLSAIYSIGGVSYSDTLQITVANPDMEWKTTDLPGFEGFKKVIAEGEKIKDKTKSVLKKIPWDVTIVGPEIGFSFKHRDCCKDGVVIVDGEKEISGSISGGISAHIPIGVPPWTASFKKELSKFGYTFKVEGEYGFFVDMGANLKGELGERFNDCKTESCIIGSLGVTIPINFKVKGSINVCIKDKEAPARRCLGKNQNGTQCGLTTTNPCGYCSSYNGGAPLHTTQSWWCFSCPSFELNLVGVSTSFKAGMTYNMPTCSDGQKWSACMDPVVIKFLEGATFLGIDLSFEKEIYKGGCF